MSRIKDDDQQANQMKLRRCCVSEFLGYKKHDLIFYHSSIRSTFEIFSFFRVQVLTILLSALSRRVFKSRLERKLERQPYEEIRAAEI